MSTFPMKRRPTPPGAMLSELYLRPRGVTISAFASAVGCSRKHMSDIVNGRARMDSEIAARVGKVLGTSTRLWVNLQSNIDVWEAERAARKWKPKATYPAAAE
ncbi:MAG: addiction module antidote protein, HigA family [Rhodospirillales bacterium]|nr:addiction module antidote protein, HigA family [Rhodospirillales bacterium]